MKYYQVMSDSYTVRWFQNGDLDAFLELYQSVMGRTKTEAWFDWKYIDNPYTDHIPIVVAEDESKLVGARGFLAIGMRKGKNEYIAYQPCDTMVHRDHRRQGLFTEMTEAAINRYKDSDVDFFFNFPNDKSKRGNLKLGWQVVGNTSEYYRIENLERLISSFTDHRLFRAIAACGGPLYRQWHTAQGYFSGNSPSISVERHMNEEYSIRNVLEFYREGSIERFHASRDVKFFNWRLDNPEWKYEIYTVCHEGRSQGAAIIGHQRKDSIKTVNFMDYLPLQMETDPSIFRSLYTAVQTYHPDADIYVASGTTFSEDVLKGLGFLKKSKFPMNRFASSTSVIARTLSDGWRIDGTDIREHDNWMLTLIEHDTN